MPKHKDWNFSTFLRSANADLVERYLLRFFRREQLPPYLVGMNPDYVEHVLDNTDDTLKAVIIDDLRRINDSCYRDLPIMAAQRFSVPLYAKDKTQAVALRLFLDFPRVFDFAWALYSYTASYADISQHWLQRHDTRTDGNTIAAFKSELQSFFANHGRGKECRVQVYDWPEELVILVQHGSHPRTIPCWQDAEITMNLFHPVWEGVLIYDKARAVLSAKVPARGDRENYVRSFSSLFLGDATLADDPDRDRIFTLKPLQTRPSDWVGDGRVNTVELRKAKLKPRSPNSEVTTLEGDGLHFTKIEPGRGELIEAKLRFTIVTDGKDEKVTFTITPPCLTDLIKKRHADVIADYLRGKGVLLR
jgi:hypothetical protein